MHYPFYSNNIDSDMDGRHYADHRRSDHLQTEKREAIITGTCFADVPEH